MPDAPQAPKNVSAVPGKKLRAPKASPLSRAIRRNLIAGLLVLIPLGVCLWVVTLMWAWVVEPVGGFTVAQIGKLVPEVFEDPDGVRVLVRLKKAGGEPGDVPETKSVEPAGGWAVFMSRTFHPLPPEPEEATIKVSHQGQERVFRRLPSMGLVGMVLGFFLVVLLVLVFGVVVRMFLGRTVIRWGEHQLERIPLLRTLYVGTKQLLQTLFEDKEEKFQGTVLVEYPRPGMWAMAFVTSSVRATWNTAWGRTPSPSSCPPPPTPPAAIC